MRARLAVVAVSVLGAVALFVWARSLGVPIYGAAVLACGPLACPGAPAALLLWNGRGGRNPYGYEVNRDESVVPPS